MTISFWSGIQKGRFFSINKQQEKTFPIEGDGQPKITQISWGTPWIFYMDTENDGPGKGKLPFISA